jgi:GTP-binding protein
MFIDQVVIQIKSGDGGNGRVHFRREKYVPKGGPDGGDGGKGGSVFIESSFRYQNLNHFRYLQRFNAEDGGAGQGKQMTGADGKDMVINVPPGTLVFDDETGELLFDFDSRILKYEVASGGKGGLGNVHFKSSTNQAPRQSIPGRLGIEHKIRLELKLLADVGLIGLPNAGKSSLLAKISAAKPKVAAYPFTTLNPQLGNVPINENRSFTVADIPGLIEGAHKGSGLGCKFLKHIERTKFLVHLIDVSILNHLDAEKSYDVIRTELEEFGHGLSTKPEVIALNKTDLVENAQTLKEILNSFEKKEKRCFLISAKTGEGVKELAEYLCSWLLKEKHELYGDISGVAG